MYMKVRTKIAILLVLCVAILAMLMLFHNLAEGERLGVLLGRESEDRAESIHRTMKVVGRSLETLALEYTCWDEMVDFILSGDKAWAGENIDASLDTYKASGVWIYNKAGALLYSVDNLKGAHQKKLPISPAEIRGLFERSKLIHFFIPTPDGPIEIRGATIHKSSDSDRKTPLSGYLLAGRLWDKAYINNLSNLTASKVKIFSADEKKTGLSSDPKSGIIVINSTLNDWRGKPIARVNISGSSEIADVFTRDSRKMLVFMLGFGILPVTLLYFVLMTLINVPLNSISLALEHEDAGHVKSLMDRKDEFGRISELIGKSFRQRDSLLTEIKERNLSDLKLAKKMKELEEAYEKLKEMQAILVQSEKLAALGRFASGVAHEVKNPLSILLGGLEYIKAKLPGADPELREALVKMREAVMRADIVVKDLLTFARPSKATTEIVHPNALIHDAIIFIELFKHKSDTADINIIQELTEKDISVEVDAGQLQQALFNILLNAIEAMPMRGDIFVKTTKDTAAIPPDAQNKAVCAIEIRDTGSGISKEDMARIFEPFFTTKRDRKGTGLGLSIVKSIIDKNNGFISVYSEINKGTMVRILLPVTDKSKKGDRL